MNTPGQWTKAQERIKHLEEVIRVQQEGLQAFAVIRDAQLKELDRLRPLGKAVENVWWFCKRLGVEGRQV